MDEPTYQTETVRLVRDVLEANTPVPILTLCFFDGRESTENRMNRHTLLNVAKGLSSLVGRTIEAVSVDDDYSAQNPDRTLVYLRVKLKPVTDNGD